MESPQFDTLAESLSPVLQNLELKRKALFKEGKTSGIRFGGIFFVIAIAASLYFNFILIGIAASVVVTAMIYFTCVNQKSKILSSYYKQEVIAQTLQSFCENATFVPEEGIDEPTFCSSSLFSSPDRYHTEDLIQGHIGKTDFQCAEVHAEERRTQVDSKGRTSHYWVDIFKGFLFIADFHKEFQGQTIVRRNSILKMGYGGSRVKLEDPLFEKTFDVYSTDQIEARYLLTPSMMERLLKLDAEFDKGITVSFRKSTILIAISESRDHFEASIWKSFSDLSLFREDFSTIHALISIVEDLNLNTRIWSKE